VSNGESSGDHDPWGDRQTGDLDEIRLFVESIVDSAGLDLDVEFLEERDALVVTLQGPDSEILLDYGGEVLQALQVILGKILPRKFGTTMRVLVDSNNYRLVHERELIEIARHEAQNVRKSGRPHEMSPMNSMERRIVHMALSEEEGITTESTGEGGIRRVQILPERSQG
jgi:spoIIIJ-associated protein